MPRFALVEFEGMRVANIATVANVPAAPYGFRNIVENLVNPALNEWTPGDDPAVNDIWDGQIPAGFDPPLPPGEVPSDLDAVKDKLAALKVEIDNAIAGISAIQGV